MTHTAPRPAGVAGALAVSAAAHLVAKVIHLALNVVASLALIRYLQPSGYGDYVFVLSIAALFGLLSDLGLSKIAVRETARDEGSASAVLGTAIATRLVLAVIAAVLVQLALALLASRAEVRIAVGIASLMYVTEALLSVVVVFQVRLQMQYEALVTVFVQAIDTVLILVLVAFGADLVQLVAAPVVSGFAGGALAFAIARGRFGSRFQLDFRLMPHLLWEAAPIGATLLLAVGYLKLDSVLLGVLATPTDVGLYGSAFRPIEYLLLAASVLITPMFPLLARWFGKDPSRFAFLYGRGTDALVAVYLPVPVLMFWIARPLVTAVFSEPFAAAALPLQVLSLALVLMVVSGWQSFALLAGGRQRLTVAYDAVALVLNVALNLILIPRFTYSGAAAASLVTAAFVVVCSTLVARQVLHLSGTASRLPRIVAANAVLAVLVGLLASLLPWWVAIVASPVPYAALLMLFRVTTLDELRAFLPSRAPSAGSAIAEVAS